MYLTGEKEERPWPRGERIGKGDRLHKLLAPSSSITSTLSTFKLGPETDSVQMEGTLFCLKQDELWHFFNDHLQAAP